MSSIPMIWRATVLTLFPEMFPGPLGVSLAGRALASGLWALDARDIRDSATDRHRSVDDTPAGGGPGMVLRADVLAAAIDAADEAREQPVPRLLMSPRGRPLTQSAVRELAAGPGPLIVCGRFEGIDQRVIEARGL
jgi:tRNA (guanine37-N1)-methyltransferase